MSGVEFDAPEIERDDGEQGRALTFRDPESGIRVVIPATAAECEGFALAATGKPVPDGPLVKDEDAIEVPESLEALDGKG